VPFHTWFDVNEAMEGTEVLATYHLNVTPEGKKELDHFGIPTVFPCIARSSRNPMILYLAGDFSDLRPPEAPYFVWGYPWYKRIGRFSEHYRDQTAFYWQFYVTLMSNILNQPIPKGRPIPVLDFGATRPDAGVKPLSPVGTRQEKFAPAKQRAGTSDKPPGGSVATPPAGETN